jgi:hypothetical protein
VPRAAVVGDQLLSGGTRHASSLGSGGEPALPIVRYARSGDVEVAYHALGEGPPDKWLRDWAGRLQLDAGTPGDAERFMRMAFEIDVRDVVPSVKVPTLVIHRTGDRLSHAENGRFLAANIEGARYLELPGDDHLLWVGERADEIPGEIQELLTGARDAPALERVLATVLFTDIVGSTERAAQLGDREWADLLRMHHATVRQELARFSGRELDTAGDGFLASFGGPASSELVDGKLGGIAVHIGAGRRRGRPG